MTIYVVTGDERRTIDRYMEEIKRQLEHPEGCPLDPGRVASALQGITEGNFDAAPRPSGRFIDCDAAPFVFDDLSVIEHHQGGRLEFNPECIRFHLEPEQRGGTLSGNELRSLLAGKPVLNACVLDHLLANPALIPESWKRDEHGQIRHIFFWDTIYRGSFNNRCVRCLNWIRKKWRWGYYRLDDRFDAHCPAAVSEI